MKCSVSLPVWHDGRYVTVKCVQVTVHLASFGPRVIPGYPLLARYGLTLGTARGSLLFDDVRTRSTYQMSPQRMLRTSTQVWSLKCRT